MNVLITGGSRGIGKAIAVAFAKEGADLFLCSQNADKLQKTVAELKLKFPDILIHSIALDLSQKEQAKNMSTILAEKSFSVDILINNAGLFLPGNISDEEDGMLEKMIAVNLYSAYHVTRSIVPEMKKQNSGHIFNICSVASLQAYPNGGSYSISKFALMGFSKNLRDELLPYNIKVTAVFPGAVMTDSWGDFDNSSNRILEAGDVAAMIVAAAKLSPQAVVEDIVLRPQLGDL
jgi:short-subunit dehydrogenase